MNNSNAKYQWRLIGLLEDIELCYEDAYCRLSFAGWYPGYRDDITKSSENNESDFEERATETKNIKQNDQQNMHGNRYMHHEEVDFEYDKKYGILFLNSLYRDLVKCAAQIKVQGSDVRIIKIDGESFSNLYGLKKCIEDVLRFLAIRKDCSVELALPYERIDEADRAASECVRHIIDENKFTEFLAWQDYQISICRFTQKSQKCLKIMSDGLMIGMVYHDEINTSDKCGNSINMVQLDKELYDRLIRWAIGYAKKNAMYLVQDGDDEIYMQGEYNVDMLPSQLGLKLDRCDIPIYKFSDIAGHGIWSELLQLPELREFVNA